MGDRAEDDTIIGAPFESLADTELVDLDGANGGLLETGSPKLFKIRGADSGGQRSSANILIKRRYAWRGYESGLLPEAQSMNRLTLSATSEGSIIGTMTIGFDGPNGIFVEDLFGPEVDEMRQVGQRLCEFTKLAVDSKRGSKRVLASLFHVAYIIAHRLRGYDTLLVEVNPRHVNYYRRMLGFRVLTDERLNQRVNAPAVLLALDMLHTREQIGKFGGRPELVSSEKSLYPYAFSLKEEAGIITRLERASWNAFK